MIITRNRVIAKAGELLSVTEYARLHGKDPGNVRRMMASGCLAGQKVGNQWVISADAAYPADRQEKSGRYGHWQRRLAFKAQEGSLMDTLKTMAAELSKIYDPLAQEMILYGFYARGTQTEESDVDIALLLGGKPSAAMTDAMVQCVTGHEPDCGKVLSVLNVDRQQYDRWKETLPFYHNIAKEGISLWKAR